MKKKELIEKMQDEINDLRHRIIQIENAKATWEYVYKLEYGMIHADQNILERIIKLEEKAECQCVQAHGLPNADILCNSHNQVNKQNEDYKDRCNVEKAFKEWKAIAHNHLKINELNQYAWLHFAVYFAERVKGGKL